MTFIRFHMDFRESASISVIVIYAITTVFAVFSILSFVAYSAYAVSRPGSILGSG